MQHSRRVVIWHAPDRLAACAQHHDPSKEDCSLTLRCLHYPPVDNSKIPANYWRAGSHTDFDTLTLLFQVCRRSSDMRPEPPVRPRKTGSQTKTYKHKGSELCVLQHMHRWAHSTLSWSSIFEMRVVLILQREGQGGLEVCPGREASTDFGVGNDWTPVVPRNDAITINIGDLLMRWCAPHAIFVPDAAIFEALLERE